MPDSVALKAYVPVKETFQLSRELQLRFGQLCALGLCTFAKVRGNIF